MEGTKKKSGIGFWGPREGQYGEYYLSNTIDAALFDELQKAQIGSRLVLNAVTSANEKAPAFNVKILPPQTEGSVARARPKTAKKRGEEDLV